MKENIFLVLGILGSLVVAAVALYRARPQRELDAATRQKMDKEAEIAVERHERIKTNQILRLETYVNRDIVYHRKNAEYQAKLLQLIQRCVVDQLISDVELPEPPIPPDLPDIPIE